MKTAIASVLLLSILFSACSKDTPVEVPETPDYRNAFTGNFESAIKYVRHSQFGGPAGFEIEKDTFATISISKEESIDSVLIVSFFEKFLEGQVLRQEKFTLKTNGIIHNFYSYPPYNSDSAGYFNNDSVSLYWLISNSPGAIEYYKIEGKKL